MLILILPIQFLQVRSNIYFAVHQITIDVLMVCFLVGRLSVIREKCLEKNVYTCFCCFFCCDFPSMLFICDILYTIAIKRGGMSCQYQMLTCQAFTIYKTNLTFLTVININYQDTIIKYKVFRLTFIFRTIITLCFCRKKNQNFPFILFFTVQKLKFLKC